MRCFILPEQCNGTGTIVIEGKEARRLIKVLRLLPGDSFPAMDTSGRRYHCVVLKTDGVCVELDIEEDTSTGSTAGYGLSNADVRTKSRKRHSDTQHHSKVTGPLKMVEDEQFPSARGKANENCFLFPELVLAVGLLKGHKLDDVVRAAAEIGVHAIQLLETERSVARETGSGKIARYERIVKEALGQSGSSVITKVLAPCTVSEFLKNNRAEGTVRGIVFHEKRTGSASVHHAVSGSMNRLVLCIGPEGGFSDRELELFIAHGYVSAWLGPSVLRADTAAIAVMSIIKLLFVEREAWQAK